MKKLDKANYQDLLKTIAIVCMILDHIGLYFLQEELWIRSIGRFVMPIFCFYAGYNYRCPKTSICILGIILTSMFFVVSGGIMWTLNMLLSIYLGQCYLYILDKYNKNSGADTVIHCIILIVLTPLTNALIEYGTIVIAFMVAGRSAARGGLGFRLLPILSIATIGLVFFTFGKAFSYSDSILAVCSVAAAGFALSHKPETPISVDLRCVSRHSLVIYFVDVALSLAIFTARYVGVFG